MKKNTLQILGVFLLTLTVTAQDYYQKTFSSASYADAHQLPNGEILLVGQVAKMSPGSAIVQKMTATGELIESNELKANGGSGLNFFGGMPNHTITMDGDNVLLSVYSSGFTGNTSIYPGLLKMDANGDVLWNKIYKNDNIQGPINARGGLSSTIIDNGNYVSSGWFNSGSGGAFDYFNMIQKTDSDGNVIWRRDFGYAFIFASDIIKASNGNYIVLGGQTGGLYMYVFEEDGDFVSQTRYGIGTVYPTANQILSTTDGGYLIIGTAAYMDGYVLKLNSNYEVEWSKRYDEAGRTESFNKVIATADGGYLIAGDTKETMSSGGDGLLVKIDANGAVLWSKTYGRATDDGIFGLTATTNGYLAVGGSGTDGWVIHTDLNGNANGCDEFTAAITALDAITTATVMPVLTPMSTTGVLEEPVTKSVYDSAQVLPYAVEITTENTTICTGNLIKLELVSPQATAVWTTSGDGDIFVDEEGTTEYDGTSKLHIVYVVSHTTQTYTAEACLLTDAIEITVNVPQAPIGNEEQELCEGSTLADLTITGTDVKWYDSEVDGVLVDETTVLTDDKTYYASQTTECGESVQRFSVKVNLVTLGLPVGDTDQVFCVSGTLSDITLTGGSIKWYDAEEGGNELELTTVLEDNKMYYAALINGCGENTERLPVTVTINNTEAPEGQKNQSSCTVNVLNDVVLTGQNVIWYDSEEDGNVLPGTTEVVDETTYYASQTIDGCESIERLPVTIEVCLSAPDFDYANTRVYPNPVVDIVVVETEANLDNITLLSVTGQIVKSVKVSGNKAEITMQDLSAGVYFMVIGSDNNSNIVKLVKQ